MGFYSDVTILAQPKAYKMIMDSIKEYNKAFNYEFKPTSIRKGNLKSLGEFFVLNWNWVKWYPGYKDVKSVESVLNLLRGEHDEEMGYGYKQVIVNEDNSTEENTNMLDLDSYLYAVCNIELDIGNTVLEEM
jgi:hypothetical protein